jgi:MerR family transcriptional regulator, light-induced transcriptional regulator
MIILMDQIIDPEAPSHRDVRSDTRAWDRSEPLRPELSDMRRADLISRMVESEILPQVARATRKRQGRSAPAATADDTNELVLLLLSEHIGDVTSFMGRMRQRGISPAAIYLGVMTDAARRLGDLWRDDRCNFVQVTIAMGRLQMAVRSLSPEFQRAAVHRVKTETVMLLPAPGDQHIFGLMVLAEFFIRDGWRVVGGPGCGAEEAVMLARENWLDIVGFSVGSTSQVDALARCIHAVRCASRNPNLRVMVGGSLVLAQPELAAHVGADAAAVDAQAATRQARGLLQATMMPRQDKLLKRSAVSL